MNSEPNGQPASNASREEGGEEAEGQPQCVQQQACADAASTPRKRQRIVYIENSSNCRSPFLVEEVGTVQELVQQICERFPEICIETLGMKISSSRAGSIGRVFYEGDLPYEQDTLYVSLYLRKHSLN